MKENKHYIALIVSIGLLIVLTLPFLLLGTTAYVKIDHNLDSIFVNFHLLKSGINLIQLPFYLTSSFYAYVINLLIVRLIGFWGMWLLAKDYLLTNQIGYSLVLAVLFALIPTQTLYGLSILGQPILVWAFLNLMHEKYYKLNWIVICVFPFYTQIGMSFLFVGSLLIAYAFWKLIAQNKVNPYYFLGLIIMAVLYAISNFQLLTSFKVEEVSQNLVANEVGLSFLSILKNALLIGLKGVPETSSFWAIPIYLLTLLALIFKREQPSRTFYVFGCTIIIGIIAFFYASYPWLIDILKDFVPILPSFHLAHFVVLIPLLWFMLLALAVQRVKMASWFVYLLIISQGILIVKDNTELVENSLRVANVSRQAPSFETYFSAQLFQSTKAYIARPMDTYQVVSLGLPASVLQYNGFQTKETTQQLSKSYTTQLKEFGISYIISAESIENSETLGLEFEKEFIREDAYWDIYLYKLN